MSTENINNGLGEQNSQPIDTSSNLNVPVVLDEYDEYEPIDFGSIANSESTTNESDEQGQAQEQGNDNSEQLDQEEPINFGEEVESEENKTVDLSDDELIERLKEKGFEVRKNEESNPADSYLQERDRLEASISQVDHALQLPDEQLIVSKLRNDLADEYQRTGRQNEINSSDFNDEVQDQLDEMSDMTRRLYLENIKEKLERFKLSHTTQLNEINERERNRVNQIVEKNLNELNTSLTKIHKEGNFLGIPVSEKDLREVHADITSNKLSKVLSSSQEIIADVALFLKYRDQIKSSITGATYGEGVKAAVDALRNGQQSGSRSPLATLIEKSERTDGSGNGKSFNSHWAPEVVASPEERKPKHVAGAGGII